MKWIEWIRLQTTGLPDMTMQNITGLCQDIRDTPGLVAIEIYTHAVITGEIAFLLFWEVYPPQLQGSLIGLQLASELKKVGLVAHSVWICKR